VRRPLLIGLTGIVVYLLATRVEVFRTADLRTLEGFMGLGPLPLARHSQSLISLFDPGSYAVLVLGVIAAAGLLGRLRIGLLAAAMMVAAGASSQVLKVLLAVQRDYPPGHYMGAEAWPSGHSTAVMAFALALVLIAPPSRRWLAAAVGGVLTVATVYGILINGWHYPSDVLGGLLLATFWASLAVLPLRSRERVSWRAPVIAGAVLAFGGLVAVLSRPEAAATYAVENTTFVFGALAIALTALVLSGSVLAPTAARPGPPGRSRHARG
jgi:membrane-associated phospholipid phosphatase